MADLFVKLMLDLPHHPKLMGAPAAAKWLYAVGFIVSARELSDGLLRPQVACAEAEVPATHVRTLVGRALWHKAGHDCGRCAQPPAGLVIIHDYLDHQQSKADVEDAKAKRSRAGRKGAASRWHGGSDDKSHGTSHGGSNDGRMADTDPEGSVVQVPSQSRSATRAIDGLTDQQLEQLRRRLGCTEAHAAGVVIEVLSRAGAEVLDPFRYVLAAVDRETDRYRPTPGPPTKADCCPISGHESYPASNCGACRADLIAVDR